MAVKIDDIYNISQRSQFVNEDQQASLNNDYDYEITRMFRIFLKQDHVYGLGPMKANHENKAHVT